MSAFCVFGISRAPFLARAKRKVSANKLNPKQWAVACDEMADELFAHAGKSEQISAAFDAPQFCEEWIALAGNTIRFPKIMARGEKKDAKGGAVLRKGIPVIGWVDYVPSAGGLER